MMKKIIDTGNDFNKDKHCDLDGYFVTSSGHHTPKYRCLSKAGNEALEKYISNAVTLLYVDVDDSDESTRALSNYSKNDAYMKLSSPSINKKLREHAILDKDEQEMVDLINEAINSQFLIKDILLSRGISIESDNHSSIENLEVGKTYHPGYFWSTSLDERVTCGYAINEKTKCLIYIDIIAKNGTACMPMLDDKINNRKQEYEMLLSAEQDYVVKAKGNTYVNGVKCIYYLMETI